MYTIERIQKEVNEICTKANIQVTFSIGINGRLSKTLGRVISSGSTGENIRMEFSRKMIESCSDKTISDVIQHECAHAIVNARYHEKHGHDAIFKAVCAEIGCSNDQSSTPIELTVDAAKAYKYTGTCSKCGKTLGHWSRAGKIVKNYYLYHCKCGGSLVITQNW